MKYGWGLLVLLLSFSSQSVWAQEAVEEEALPWLVEAENTNGKDKKKVAMEILPIGDRPLATAGPVGEVNPNGEAPSIAYAITFNEELTEYTAQVTEELTQLVKLMQQDARIRIKLQSYAYIEGSTGDSVSRRLSLSRAIKLRNFFITRGIKSERIIVQALGDTAKSGAKNRIDIQSL